MENASKRNLIAGACLLAAAAAFVAVFFFKVPLRSLFFFVMIAACPLMHVFMMGGHGGHSHGGQAPTAPALKPETAEQDAAEKTHSCH